MIRHIRMDERDTASMKALPKRKGNYGDATLEWGLHDASMKALPRRKGNSPTTLPTTSLAAASMKVPTRRQRNAGAFEADRPRRCLNESPSQKEGKWCL